MKVTGVRTQAYEITLRRAIGDANDPRGSDRMPMLAVWLDSDAGPSGIAFGTPAARGLIHALVQDLLVGRDPRGVRGHWKRMLDAVFKGGNRGLANAAVSALDVALWDLKARLRDEPLWKTLGASTRKVRAYASGIDLNLDDAALRRFYEAMAARGVHAGKLKVGLDPDGDLRRLAIVRDALATSGKSPVLMVDANEYWSPKQAIRHLRAYEARFDLFWVEEPARRWDVRGLRAVSRAVRAAVATGENLDDASEFRPLVAGGAVDVVQVGARTGGITGAMAVADLAYGFDLPVSLMNCPAHFMAHLAAALPNHVMMECAMLGRSDGVLGHHAIEDGWITLSDRPGLGIEFDPARLQALAVETPGGAARAGGWGRRRGAGLLEVRPGEDEEPGEE
jgi:L-alanine-DL-glutamate epimerase-like enolase superfamily enzyme